jgi:hypothetical protein
VWRIVARTSEQIGPGEWTPVLEHHFLGATLEDAVGIYVAHLGADAFFAGCVAGAGYRGVVCRTTLKVIPG